MTQVISLGLDGAAWHELDRLMDAGELPNLARVVEDGARAPLRSVTPPVTCPAWRCSTAGKNPGKLGVFWWLTLDRATGEFATPDASAFDTVDVWDYLSAAGHRCAVVNVPMTYPPSEIRGVMVAGFGAPFEQVRTAEASITHPPDRQAEIVDEYDWQVGIDDVTDPAGPERAHDLVRSRFELLGDLLAEGYDYLHLTVFYVNVLQHKYGNGPETVEAWRIIDDYLGDLLAEDALLVVYSDHGHSTVERTFSVNEWLRQQGHLAIDDSAADTLLARVYDGLKATGASPRRVAWLAERLLPSPLYDALVTSGYPISTGELSARVDWERSTAVALSQGPVYLNREALGDDYRSFREELRSTLASVTHDGEPVFSRVRAAEEVYDGPYVGDGPDLLLSPADTWELYGGLTPSVVEEEVTSWTSGNHPVGVLAMAGDDVASVDLPERSILDVAPTVLQYMDCDVPADMDGEVVRAAFDADLGPRSTRPPMDGTSDDGRGEAGDLQSHLADLGYLE